MTNSPDQLYRGIVCGRERRTHEEISFRVARLAGGLSRLGVKQGDSVCILMRNDISFLEVSYATMRLGAYAVPLNWHFKPDELRYILLDSKATVLIAHVDLLHEVRDCIPQTITVICLNTPSAVLDTYSIQPDRLLKPESTIDYETWLTKQAPYDGPIRPQPQSMIYTSGTTGHPKGVRREAPTPEQQAHSDRLRTIISGLTEGSRVLMPGPLYHSAPNGFALRAGRLGGVLTIMPRFDAEEFLASVERDRIEMTFMVPTMFVRLLKLPEGIRRRYDISSLKRVVHAAAPCPAEVKRAMIEWWGPIIYEFYGSTESGPVTLASSEDALKKPGTVGKVMPWAELRFIDDNGNILSPGHVGEIYTRIAGTADFAYHNQPGKRKEVDRDGFVTSGDVGYLDEDGYVFICDRKRDMVISGGVNIYPAEIEAVLHTMKGVQDCAVFGIPDPEFGEALMAVVEPVVGDKIDPTAIRAHLKASLADYKVPKHIEIRPELPREDSGKIFKRRLRDPYWVDAGRRI
ncbi:acyl-CoA synthetase [Bradyrhizobium sp. HKCCYLS2038]|uniref:acyl-CoA synthetase n=1 Tax=unclassified Bradyrhizobium TaxID=2631580 RepID=UPI003EBC5418